MGLFVYTVLPATFAIVGLFARPLARRWNRWADEHNAKHGFSRTEDDQPTQQVHAPIQSGTLGFPEEEIEAGRKAAMGTRYVPASRRKLRVYKITANMVLCGIGLVFLWIVGSFLHWRWTNPITSRQNPMRSVLEIALALVTLVAGMLWWQLRKRRKFLRQVVRDESYLRQIISRELFLAPPARISPYLHMNSLGYVFNIDVVTKADVRSQRSAQLLPLVLLATVAAVSLHLGYLYLAINGMMFFVSGLGPIHDSAKFNAVEHVLTLALILHKWNVENPTECGEFIAAAKSLQPLYQAVQAASD